MLKPSLRAVAVVALLAAGAFADDQKANDKGGAKPTHVTIAKIDAARPAITIQYTDDKGQKHEKTFQLTKDVRLLDETGRAIKIDVFESGNDALLVEEAGTLRELRLAPGRLAARHLSDSVRTEIELAEYDEASIQDLQKIYDMLRKLDPGKSGKIDPHAVKAAADHILAERVQGVFERLDMNHDGKISKDEARGLVKEHFDRLDTNHDGFIDKDELMKAAKERQEQRSTDAKSKSQATGKEKN